MLTEPGRFRIRLIALDGKQCGFKLLQKDIVSTDIGYLIQSIQLIASFAP